LGNGRRQRRGGTLDPKPRYQILVLRPAPHKHNGDLIKVYRRPSLATAELPQHREEMQSIVSPEPNEDSIDVVMLRLALPFG
jgi:hypothetical protein